MTERHEGRQWSSSRVLLGVAIGLALSAGSAAAQELTPRAYWPAPKGINVAVAGYVYANGDVLFDPSIPLYGVDSEVNIAVLAYLRTLSLWGRTTTFVADLPYQWSTTKGTLVDTPVEGSVSDFGDLSVTLSVNLLGAPTMTPQELQAFRADPKPILGASLKVVARPFNTTATGFSTRAATGGRSRRSWDPSAPEAANGCSSSTPACG